MSLYTGTVKGLNRAPYRDQVLVHMIGLGISDTLSAKEETKIARVQRFLHAQDCAREIDQEREKAGRDRP